jgi:hypothetical protein
VSRDAARLRAGVWAALEHLEAGDPRGACDTLLALVEDSESEPRAARCRCSGCGATFRWPGELDGHAHRCPAREWAA